jgi:hypothetical protein
MGVELGLLANRKYRNSNSNFNNSCELHRLAVFENNNTYEINMMVK